MTHAGRELAAGRRCSSSSSSRVSPAAAPRIAHLAGRRAFCSSSRVNVASGKLEDVPLFSSDTSSLLSGGSGSPSTSGLTGLSSSKAAAAPSLDSVELKSGVGLFLSFGVWTACSRPILAPSG